MANEVVVFADLVALLAKSTGTTEALCDSFLRELLALGVEKLTRGNDFLVKGLGTFRQIGGVVVFDIDNSFAAVLKSSFDCVEVSVAVTEEPSTDETIKEADSDANTATPDYDAEYGYDDDSSSSKPRWQLFVYGIVCGIVVAVIAYFALAYFGILPTTQEQNVVVDTQIPSVAADTVVIDTIYPIMPHACNLQSPSINNSLRLGTSLLWRLSFLDLHISRKP